MTRNPDALIRIEDAIKVLCREKCYPGLLCPDNRCDDMWDKFEDVGRVDAVPVVHGLWIHDGSKWAERWVCDQCGFKLFGAKTNFCGGCGCRMMEVEHEAD